MISPFAASRRRAQACHSPSSPALANTFGDAGDRHHGAPTCEPILVERAVGGEVGADEPPTQLQIATEQVRGSGCTVGVGGDQQRRASDVGERIATAGIEPVDEHRPVVGEDDVARMEIAVAEHHRAVGGQLGEHVGGDDADVMRAAARTLHRTRSANTGTVIGGTNSVRRCWRSARRAPCIAHVAGSLTDGVPHDRSAGRRKTLAVRPSWSMYPRNSGTGAPASRAALLYSAS